MTAMTMLASECESPGGNAMEVAALTIADKLTDHEFELRTPGWDGSHLLKVLNARGLLCEILVSADGLVEWECRPIDGHQADPARTAEMVRCILGGNADDKPTETLPGRFGLQSIAGRMLADSGMAVSVQAYTDSFFFAAYADLDVTNPGQPGRGRARITDDGTVIWQCRIRAQPGDNQALDPAEIADIITQALTDSTGHAHGHQAARNPRAVSPC